MCSSRVHPCLKGDFFVCLLLSCGGFGPLLMNHQQLKKVMKKKEIKKVMKREEIEEGEKKEEKVMKKEENCERLKLTYFGFLSS